MDGEPAACMASLWSMCGAPQNIANLATGGRTPRHDVYCKEVAVTDAQRELLCSQRNSQAEYFTTVFGGFC